MVCMPVSEDDYTAPRPNDGEYPEEWPERVIWVEGYGFDDDVFQEVMQNISAMFQDCGTVPVADVPSDSTAREKYVEAMEMAEEAKEDNDSI